MNSKLPCLLIASFFLLASCNLPAELVDYQLIAQQSPSAPGPTILPATVTQTLNLPTQTSPRPGTFPTATATLLPKTDDSAYKSGKPTWLFDLNAQTLPWISQDNALKLSLEAEGLKVTSQASPFWSHYPSAGINFKNAFYEMKFKFLKCSGSDRFGISVVHQNGPHYYFAITCDSSWGFTYYDSYDQTFDLIPYAQSPLIKPSPQYNTLGILVKGNTFLMFINGSKIGDITESSISDVGSFGFHIMPVQDEGTQVVISSYIIWEQP